MTPLRRVATGHDEQGLACVASDGPVTPFSPALMPGYHFELLWTTDGVPVYPDAGEPGPPGDYFPPLHGW